MTQEELNNLITLHETWLSSSGAEGAKLEIVLDTMASPAPLSFATRNISQAIIANSNLTGANFSDCVAIDANISNCLMGGANFARGNFTRVDFSNSRASGSNFDNAIFTDANFTGSTGFDFDI